jgi:diguanylate cyclase (GGDEF)-like protein/PAS domain S-box-containing protein
MVLRRIPEYPVKAPKSKNGAPYIRWLESQRRIYELILGALPEGVVVMLPDGATTYLNAAAERLLGLDSAGCLERVILDSFREATGQSCAKRLLECATDGAGYRCRGFVRHESDGNLPVELDISTLRDRHGEIVRLIVTFRDLRREIQREQELERLAMTDQLTQCKNRWWFEKHYADAFARAQKDGGWLGLIFVDLDNFKTVNDESYEVGDGIIHQSAEALASVLRATDSLVRLGGDEFVFVAQGLDLTTVLEIVRRMAVALGNVHYTLSKKPDLQFHVTASIGVSVLKGHDPRLSEIKIYAQEAKRLAKINGKNRFRILPEEDEEQPSVH